MPVSKDRCTEVVELKQCGKCGQWKDPHKEFYKDNSEIKKYIDVNSHSIDDLEADLNGKGKEQIIGMLKKLFDDNNYAGHYSKYWTDESE